MKITPAILLIVLVAFVAVVSAWRGNQITPPPQSSLKGLSWYGLDLTDPDWHRLNKAQFDIMVTQFPNMKLLVLPLSAHRATEERISLLKDFVEWCRPHGIKVIVSNYMTSLDEVVITDYWVRLAGEFKGDSAVAGFDLVNEPWAFAHGNAAIIPMYERIIDAIRQVDTSRKCYVQSYLKHEEGYQWIRTNPVNRPNIEYVTHIYSHNYETGAWLSWCEWNQYYSVGDYEQGKTVLQQQLYDRFGFAIQELNVKFMVSEVATIDDPHAKQYFKDLIGIIQGWGCGWAYAHYYTAQDRACALTFPDGSLRGHASTVQALL